MNAPLVGTVVFVGVGLGLVGMVGLLLLFLLKQAMSAPFAALPLDAQRRLDFAPLGLMGWRAGTRIVVHGYPAICAPDRAAMRALVIFWLLSLLAIALIAGLGVTFAGPLGLLLPALTATQIWLAGRWPDLMEEPQ